MKVIITETVEDLNFFRDLISGVRIEQLPNTRFSQQNHSENNLFNGILKGYYAGALNSFKGIEIFQNLDLPGVHIDLYGVKPDNWYDTRTCRLDLYEGVYRPCVMLGAACASAHTTDWKFNIWGFTIEVCAMQYQVHCA